MTGSTVVSLFPQRQHAESAVRDLKLEGFTDEQIGIAMQDPGGLRDFTNTESRPADQPAADALNGGLAGGLLGLIGSLLIPGLGPLTLGGVLASTLTGVGHGAATGGLTRLLVGMGVPEGDAQHVERGLRAGGVLLTVSTPSRIDEATAIIQRHLPDPGFTSTISLGLIESHEPGDRRYRSDPSYSGPERRLAVR